jgi:hypothetical protein
MPQVDLSSEKVSSFISVSPGSMINALFLFRVMTQSQSLFQFITQSFPKPSTRLSRDRLIGIVSIASGRMTGKTEEQGMNGRDFTLSEKHTAL